MTEVYPIAADGGSAQEVLRKCSGSAQEVLRKCGPSIRGVPYAGAAADQDVLAIVAREALLELIDSPHDRLQALGSKRSRFRPQRAGRLSRRREGTGWPKAGRRRIPAPARVRSAAPAPRTRDSLARRDQCRARRPLPLLSAIPRNGRYTCLSGAMKGRPASSIRPTL